MGESFDPEIMERNETIISSDPSWAPLSISCCSIHKQSEKSATLTPCIRLKRGNNAKPQRPTPPSQNLLSSFTKHIHLLTIELSIFPKNTIMRRRIPFATARLGPPAGMRKHAAPGDGWAKRKKKRPALTRPKRATASRRRAGFGAFEVCAYFLFPCLAYL